MVAVRPGDETGPVQRALDSSDVRVEFGSIHGSRVGVIKTIAAASINLSVEVFFVIWLFQPSHLAAVGAPGVPQWSELVIVALIAFMELFRLVTTLSLSLASIVACDPIFLAPPEGLRVALVTTIVPKSEPMDMVARTLVAARQVRYPGLHVWLLDEGNRMSVRARCRGLRVRHFSRRGIDRYNTPSGRFEARTKHGNLNAWLDRHGDRYDVVLCIDPDHIPVPEYANKVLGYLRDQDVAFVGGPQVYGNVETLVSRGAESQQFPFHSIIQRAANRYGVPMLVGTNNAIRVTALQQVGGFSPSITEDMATGFSLHAARNPETGNRWRSVYIPDVLAVGQGPTSWSAYYGQQLRWSRGTFQVISRDLPRKLWRLSPLQLLHYALIFSFYPSMALGWLLGAANLVLFLAVGAHGISVPLVLWLVLYLDSTAFQLWIYVRARQHNVSPTDDYESPGLLGMVMTVMTTPIYVTSLVGAVFRRPARFVVTPKSSAVSGDSWLSFRFHLGWAAFYAAALTVAIVVRHASVVALLWPALALLVCVAPIAIWRVQRLRRRGPALQVVPDRPVPVRPVTVHAVSGVARAARTPVAVGETT